MKTVFLTVLSATLALSAVPAMAGEGSFVRSDGFELTIKCKGSGCIVRGKKPGGNWGKVERGPGGSKNYKKLVAKYAEKGFKKK